MNVTTAVRIDHDDALDMGVRVGLVCYGVVHLLMAWLALQLALGDNEGSVSGSGALRQLAANELGGVTLYVVAAGFAAVVVWLGVAGGAGPRDERGARRAWERAASAGRALIYGVLGWSALRIAMGDSQSSGTDSMTSRLMSLPWGALLVGLVGVVIISVAVGLAVRGLRERFLKDMDGRGRTGHDGRAYRWLGKTGYVSKGVAIALVGSLFVYAAWTHDPDKSGGLDQALLQVLQQPFGPFLLGLVAAGIACFGVFCFAWARHLDR